MATATVRLATITSCEVPVSSPPPVMRALAAEVDLALDAALDRLLPRLETIDPALGALTPSLRTFLSDGKRIRPVLLLLGFRAAGGTRHQAVLGPALALELLHTCALLHDDVIDAAETRRGRPTVHRSFAASHRTGGWRGDPTHYGEAVAILLGDLALIQADELFLEAEVPERTLLEAFRRFTVLREEVMAGQFLDLQVSVDGQGGRERALTVATLKSGRYSVSRPLEIGAALAGADDTLIEALRATGDPLGRAFQIRDDLLGVFGHSELTGKSVASDLAEGKRTLLVAEALDRLDDAGRDRLLAGLGDPDLDEAGAAALRELIDGCGARDATEAYVDAAIAESRAALAALPIGAEARGELDAVAGYLGAREA
ncbi:MAG: polyprenyl synthetase family protein [Nitriliruptoraceae bacterium]|nr:polyprenyl synthetase family protein [Nitriliruptoraceae bacterium]